MWERFLGQKAAIRAVINPSESESPAVGIIRSNTESSEAGPSSVDDNDLDEDIGTGDDLEGLPTESKAQRQRLKAARKKAKKAYEFVQGPQDVCGVVFMEVQCAKDLPKEKNGTNSFWI